MVLSQLDLETLRLSMNKITWQDLKSSKQAHAKLGSSVVSCNSPWH